MFPRGKSLAEKPVCEACASTPERVLMHAEVVAELVVDFLSVEKKRNRVIQWHSLTIDLDEHRLSVGNCVVSSSRAEIGLLHLLISRRNLPMAKECIMSCLFGHEHGRDLRQVDMFVARLRQSLSSVGLSGLIHTVSGRGYAVLDDHDDAGPARMEPHGWEMAALAS